ncbi:class I SAM-dependent methyltransferase [Glacieibacterium frigidum]|uniref:Class I SAM-dependent methyltransferase n=2 Tax=Glacieibacterium frigidum TaxID=2593303 RepID=A0A552UAS6_9SPHN|nr:class I SAM-dependent methyltransferase [Glacieibacterium frigidum]
MARCNAHYYATRNPLGTAGDFTTAPEISQMFGELLGASLADAWTRAGQPPVRIVELGPGRGTLMADMLRVLRRAGCDAPVHFVETSPTLRAAQARAVPDAAWHDDLAQVPDDRALLLVANEFFDALPVRQFERTPAGWRERTVAHDGTRFAPALGAVPVDILVPPALADAATGGVFETSPASTAIVAEIGARLRANGGAALIVDYGHVGPVTGDTLQGVRAHAFADPFDTPGEVDLTCHVDFSALAHAAGVTAQGPVGQGAFLTALGIAARAERLGGQEAALARLTDADAMGSLFKVLGLIAYWPRLAGFDV